ncbi:ATP-dependent DNA helicase DinG [compost metagenome]
MSEVQKDILSFFPQKEVGGPPRKTQGLVIQEVHKAFQSGKRIVILESPVGSGKSAIAKTFANYFQDSHILTPRKSLQNQYYDDFSADTVLMKGRNSYPCTRKKNRKIYLKVTNDIRNGSVAQPRQGEDNCATAPCRNSKTVYQSCIKVNGECPYNVAIEVAQEHHTVIHNIHSFVFQTNFGEKFERRKFLALDEAHEIEEVIRGFIAKKITINKVIQAGDLSGDLTTLSGWCDFFLQDKYLPEITPYEKASKERDEEYVTDQDRYKEMIETLRDKAEYYGKEFTYKRSVNYMGQKPVSTTFEFIPHSLGSAVSRLILEYGDYVLLMSGTIYDKVTYCKNIGLNPDDVYFIRVPSSFPVKMRPIYLKPEYQVDTSFANWNDNFNEMIEKINKIMKIFHDVKGLIHAPSYEAAELIAKWLPANRAMVHDKSNFQERLEEFYEAKEPKVFISPVCQQGVDFKGDRARFQIVLRIPYLNTSDEFVNFKVKNDFIWYNYAALVVFGQQVGRVNRSEDDFGATFLMDSRFNRFISSNQTKLPKWLKDAFVYK